MRCGRAVEGGADGGGELLEDDGGVFLGDAALDKVVLFLHCAKVGHGLGAALLLEDLGVLGKADALEEGVDGFD